MAKVSDEHERQVRRHRRDAAWRVVDRDGVGATARAALDEAATSAGALYGYLPSEDGAGPPRTPR